MNQKMFYVYVYTDPRNNLPIYVGKGTGDRYRSHLSGSHNKFLNAKINKIREEGQQPTVEIVYETSDEQSAYDHEEMLIKKYGRYSDGGTLCNFSLGTVGNVKYQFDDKFFSLLGTKNDVMIAEDYGCCPKLVQYYRRSRDIPAYTGYNPRKVPPPDMGGWNKITLPDECILLLGTMPDYKLGELYGVTKYVVARVRRELGIESYAASTGNNGRASKDNVVRADKTKYQFLNEITGEGYLGSSFNLSEHLGVKAMKTRCLVKKPNSKFEGWVMVDKL